MTFSETLDVIKMELEADKISNEEALDHIVTFVKVNLGLRLARENYDAKIIGF